MSGEDDQSGEKEFDASQRKLDEARRKGDIPKSNDLNTAAGYGGILLAASAFGATTLPALGTALAATLGRAAEIAELVFDGAPQAPLRGLALATAQSIAPWFLLPAALVLLTLLAQQALVFSGQKLQSKLNRISPLQSMKQKFGRAGLFEFLKSFLKLVLYSLILGFYVWAELPRMMEAMALAPGQIAVELGRFLTGIMLIVLLVALSLGVFDYLFQRAEHLRKLRMTRKEMTDEMKESEGDPYIKQQRRQKAVSLALNQMLAEVPRADVVIVNPTHYAVALRWDRASGRAPVCVAKGVDEIAARIREAAAENGVPIHSDPPTARALHATVEIGDEIQRDQYKAVAAAIRFAERMRKAARARGW
ncbi:EscU/YscU/HrcU family type III secretion system export apparatus switch protein [Pseudoroseicyclus tamaricis]|uniref:Flagellar biosynthesis protein FlhB n=1 Tax=Pseudoroseicyclus tamaricis TaxID=2705421 RepID=A0A6B2JVK9_9RHOB|nr:flagellar type III secretion system protein FlhB [Pseudoroseicyclus tamaricis]NDV02537.1 flagellar biosynthesis protein FlhB [Pseudoroseicyclus tamaricis]